MGYPESELYTDPRVGKYWGDKIDELQRDISEKEKIVKDLDSEIEKKEAMIKKMADLEKYIADSWDRLMYMNNINMQLYDNLKQAQEMLQPDNKMEVN